MEQDPPELQEAVRAIGAGDFRRSFTLVEQLARLGQPLAQHFLGWHYHMGIGAGQNDDRAVEWWLRAARQGITESQQGLGWAYEHGRGVDQDFGEAYRWYSRAVRGGDQEAKAGLHGVAGKLSPEQIRAIEAEFGDD